MEDITPDKSLNYVSSCGLHKNKQYTINSFLNDRW